MKAVFSFLRLEEFDSERMMGMYVVMNELHVPDDAKETMQERFAKSVEHMKNTPGCIDFMFLEQNEENGSQVVFTKWESKQHYEDWVNSDAFKKAHQHSNGSEKKSAATGSTLKAFDVIHHF
ncbi:antibiotic biosynthesis monooxygenase family protein [Salibacterium qingdaonense]|nr:antibiotic biosynthesis monooxygenase family protein [Salibacterium qingdaonense]